MIINRIRSLLSDKRGVAAVEFALILPLLITLYLGSVEGGRLYTVDRKVAVVASTMADLVARSKHEISESKQLNKYATAAESIMTPYAWANLKQVVSLLLADEDGEVTVVWSRAFGGGTAHDAGDTYEIDADAEIVQMAQGASGYIVASEMEYAYSPLVNLIIPADMTLKHVEYFLPRFDAKIELKT